MKRRNSIVVSRILRLLLTACRHLEAYSVSRPAIGLGMFIVLHSVAVPMDAQIIRSYENLDRTAGDAYYATAVVAFDGSAGNADFVDVDLSGAAGYRGNVHWLRFYPALRTKRSGGEKVIDARSLHLRHSLFLTNRTSTFAFVQLQSEASIDLDRRFLVGGGIRYQLVRFNTGGVDFGVGMMREEERRTLREARATLRGANLLSVYGSVGATSLSLVAYFQPELGNWKDHRILLQGNLLVALVGRLNLDISSSWRREGVVPVGIEKNDARLQIGFRYDLD
jgi:hypothetical protein